MKKNTKYLLILIVIIFISIVILVGILLNLNIKEENITNTEETRLVLGEIEQVKSEEMLYTIQNCIQRYLSYANVDVTKKSEINALGGRQTTAEIYGLTTEKEKEQAIYNFLDKEYIKENSITIDNLNSKVELTANELKRCRIEKINCAMVGENVYAYQIVVKWTNTNKEKEEIHYGNFIVTVDKTNETFMVKPIKEESNRIKVENRIQIIEKNNINTYTEVKLNDGEIATRYMQRYTEMLLEEPEKAYELLDNEYKQKRFENIENLRKYVNNNKEYISSIHIMQFIVNKKESYTEYICKDQNGNIMVFNVENVNSYSVKLDTYTIPTQEYIDKYKEAKEEGKVALNTDKFVKMLNNRDYFSIYKLLDDEFKNSYFKTEEEFEGYMKAYFSKVYTYQLITETKQGDVFVQRVSLREISKPEQVTYELYLMMKLDGELDFKVSFNYEKDV